MKTPNVVLAVSLLSLSLACGSPDAPLDVACRLAAQPAVCNSTCAITRPWLLTCDTGESAVRMLALSGGAPAHWTSQEAGGLTCTYDLNLTTVAGGVSGAGTFSVDNAACPSLPKDFAWEMDQCNCVLAVSGPGFNALYY